MILATSVAIVTSVYPSGERGRVLGINSAAVYLGQSLGPVLGGLITQQFGWRGIFHFSICWGTVILILIQGRLKEEWIESAGEPFDRTGALLYGISLAVLSCGFLRLSLPSGIVFLILGTIGLILFGCWETRTCKPLLEMALFRRNRTFTFSSLSALINYSAVYAVGFLLSLYLQYVKRLSPGQAGLMLIVQPVVQALVSPLTGKLSDRFEPGRVASLGMLLTVVALSGLITLGAGTGLGFIIACLLLLGLGLACFTAPNTNAIMSSVDKRLYGVASGVMGTMRLVGQMLSMSVSMVMLSLFVGREGIISEKPLQFIRSVQMNFLVMAALCLAGIFTSLSRGKVRDSIDIN
jgi:MFS family permease